MVYLLARNGNGMLAARGGFEIRRRNLYDTGAQAGACCKGAQPTLKRHPATCRRGRNPGQNCG